MSFSFINVVILIVELFQVDAKLSGVEKYLVC